MSLPTHAKYESRIVFTKRLWGYTLATQPIIHKTKIPSIPSTHKGWEMYRRNRSAAREQCMQNTTAIQQLVLKHSAQKNYFRDPPQDGAHVWLALLTPNDSIASFGPAMLKC